MTKLLLTGFEPYGATPINPAEQVVNALQGQRIAQVEVATTIVPNTFFKSIEHVKQRMLSEQADYVLMLGEYPGRALITFERYAHRIIDSYRYQLADNDGVSYADAVTVADGPVAYQSQLPLKTMVETLRAEGIPADISDTAGTFVCNHLFYGILHEIATQELPIKAGWVHLPMLPSTAALTEFLGTPSMALETAVAGIKAAIAVMVQTTDDLSCSVSAGLQI